METYYNKIYKRKNTSFHTFLFSFFILLLILLLLLLLFSFLILLLSFLLLFLFNIPIFLNSLFLYNFNVGLFPEEPPQVENVFDLMTLRGVAPHVQEVLPLCPTHHPHPLSLLNIDETGNFHFVLELHKNLFEKYN